MPPTKRSKKTNKSKLLTLLDKQTEILIYFIVIFSTWAFGTTEVWSTWVMNYCAYTMGFLLMIKWLLKLPNSYKFRGNSDNYGINKVKFFNKICVIIMNSSIFLVLIYILISAINARGEFNINSGDYIYYANFNESLPHSYDASATWELFWKYLALSILYFAVKYWIIDVNNNFDRASYNSERMNKLFNIICINAGLVALIGIFQRQYYEGSSNGRLLFLIEPNININNTLQFGPYAYRGNAATYFNLIWPIGIWLIFNSSSKVNNFRKIIGSNPNIILIPFIILCFSATILTYSRGGLIIAGLNLFFTVLILTQLIGLSKYTKFSFLAISGFIAFICVSYGEEIISSRFNSFKVGMADRLMLAEKTIELIKSYNILGTGPGTFETIAKFEIGDGFEQWESWAHNDYLEFYLTFGLPGFLFLSIIAIIPLIKLISKCFASDNKLHYIILISVFGLLVNAIFDFPFQVYSINLIFVIIIASMPHFVGNNIIYK